MSAAVQQGRIVFDPAMLSRDTWDSTVAEPVTPLSSDACARIRAARESVVGLLARRFGPGSDIYLALGLDKEVTL